MPRIVRSEAAERDVVEIIAYIAERSPDRARRMLDRFDQALRMLCEQPLAGPTRPEIAEGIRSYPVGRYVLFYRPVPDGIELVRVLHGARDLPVVFDDID